MRGWFWQRDRRRRGQALQRRGCRLLRRRRCRHAHAPNGGQRLPWLAWRCLLRARGLLLLLLPVAWRWLLIGGLLLVSLLLELLLLGLRGASTAAAAAAAASKPGSHAQRRRAAHAAPRSIACVEERCHREASDQARRLGALCCQRAAASLHCLRYMPVAESTCWAARRAGECGGVGGGGERAVNARQRPTWCWKPRGMRSLEHVSREPRQRHPPMLLPARLWRQAGVARRVDQLGYGLWKQCESK